MSRLDSHIDEFLKEVRVGIDFGESAGGIALVRGTVILHAETYVDLHESTLEQRRATRRGRRTRRSKKHRLARLRSWVLRQKLPDGSRLPDPYEVLADKRLWAPPGQYRDRGHKSDPKNTWIKYVSAGNGTSDEFVCALTLLFKKRGYKYDDRGFQDLSNKEFREFLETARIPHAAADLQKQVEQEIERRVREVEDRKQGPLRTALEAELKAALKRERKPGIAEPRQVKEAELDQVVQGFGCSAGLPDDTVKRWQKELKGLLNKVIQPARFDNRMRTRCSWCDAAYPPRKAKVRELAYRAAVNNLRVSEGRRVRRLNDEEQQCFCEWWNQRADSTPSLDTIKRTIGRLSPSDSRRSKDQKKMASQFYNLLKYDRPPGRVNLCRKHLAMAARGQTMKDANISWGTLRKRNAPNPMREQRDLRILNRLERLLFHRDRTGEAAWRHGPVAYVNLEIPEPDTEQAKPGSESQRQERTFRQRLFDESGGQCLYCGENIGEQGFEKDHIYPRSQGGPDIWYNLIAACRRCNDSKGRQTPYQWLGGLSTWDAFCARVEAADLVPRKKTVLLNQEETFPGGDPTPLARVGARSRAFIACVQEMFKKYEVPPPELNYQHGIPHVQRVAGRLTTKLRRSWPRQFSKKDRASLYNHAEDAVLVSACPPHTWRDLIFCDERVEGRGTDQERRHTGLADSRLAPDWKAYREKKDRPPLVQVLGKYHGSWKRSVFDQSLWAHSKREPKDKRLISHKPIRFDREGIDPQKHIYGRNDAGVVVPEVRKTLQAAVPADLKKQLKEIDAEGKRKKEELEADVLSKADLKKQLKELRAEAKQKKEELEADVKKGAQKALSGAKRVLMYSQKGSDLVLRLGNNRKQTVDSKAARDGIVLWTEEPHAEANLRLSSLRPWSLVGLKTTGGETIRRIDPPISPTGRRRKMILRHDILYLPESGEWPEGWYRVTQATPNGLKVIPEDAISRNLREKLGLKDTPEVKERTVGKQALWKLLGWREGRAWR